MTEFRSTARAATVEDAAGIAELMTQLGYPTGTESMRARLAPILAAADYATFMTEHRGQAIAILGVCLCRHYARDGISGRIVAVSVAEAYRGRGLGRTLVEQAESWVRERGGARMIVNTHTRRMEAHAFYRALQYEQTGLRFARTL